MQNIVATISESDTPLTQPCSLDVHAGLIALRVKHGSDTPIGHRCSNIAELLKAPVPTGHLIKRQMTDLERLLATSQ